jgi:hypothetical protein
MKTCTTLNEQKACVAALDKKCRAPWRIISTAASVISAMINWPAARCRVLLHTAGAIERLVMNTGGFSSIQILVDRQEIEYAIPDHTGGHRFTGSGDCVSGTNPMGTHAMVTRRIRAGK